MTQLSLFFAFLQIGAFSFGGGYAAMPLIQRQVVELHPWLSMGEFADLVTLSQMTPGPIAINAATFVGMKIGGLSGALWASLGCVLPSCLLVSLIAVLYLRYRELSALQSVLFTLRPAVVSMIAVAGLSILRTAAFADGEISRLAFQPRGVILFLLSMYLLLRKRLSPILVMLLAGLCNIGLSYLF